MKKKKTKSSEIKQNSKEEILTRRNAIKRIAAVVGGAAAVGAGMFVKVPQASGQYSSATKLSRYISIEGSYVNTVYADNYKDKTPYYNDYVSYYTSYRSHYSSVPPPYSSYRYSSYR